MNEENSFIPTLTLEPNAEAVAAAAAQPAPTEEDVKKDIPVERPELSKQVLNYGSNAQKNIAEFSGAALNCVRTKDLGEVGGMLGDLVVELQGLNFEPEEKKGFLGLFKKASQNIASLKAQYDKAEVNVDKIVESLENHEVVLMKDISMLDKMYEKNQEYLKELTMYILAGKLRVEELRSKDLPEMVAKAQQSGLPEDAQAANDFANMIGRFEKKIHDLELTRTISIQMSPQIREHHPPLEEPDGSCPVHVPLRAGDEGSA